MKNKIKLNDYFKNNEHSINIFKKKYMNEENDKYVDDVFNRIINELENVSCENSDVEKYKKIWLKHLIDGYWRAGGSILAALNKPDKKISVFNCSGFVIREDTLKSIYETRYRAAKAAAYRQGFGVLFDNIRPKAAKINNAAEISEGIVHWMESFDRIGIECGQKSRFPAQLYAVTITHPDVIDAIKAKVDLGKIQNANISIMVNDNFMDALDNDGDWELIFEFKDNSQEPIIKKMKARELFDILVEYMWKTAEPGILFKDRIKSWSIQEALNYKIEITNAPLTPETLIYTDCGLCTIEELYNKYKAKDLKEKVFIDSIFARHYLGILTNKNWYAFEVEKYENQKIYELVLENNIVLRCNAEHSWFTPLGKKKTKELNNTDYILFPIHNIWTNSTKYDEESFNNGAFYYLYYFNIHSFIRSEKISKSNKFFNIIKEYFDKHNILYETTSEGIILHETLLPLFDKTFVMKNRFFCAGYLSSLFTDKLNVKYDSNNEIYIEIVFSNIYENDINFHDIQLLLMAFGILSYHKKSDYGDFIYIKDILSIYNFVNNIKVIYDKKLIDRLYNNLFEKTLSFEIRKVKIKNVKETNDISDMYCLKIPNIDGFIANGFVSANCGEKPIPDNGVCCLASLNATKIPHLIDKDNNKIILSENQKSKLDIFLETVIPPLVRFMDDVVQYEIDNDYKSPIPEQLQVVKDLREIGIGITNLHKWFFDQGIEYDSDYAIEIIDYLYSRIQYFAFKASCKLAKERGACPAFLKAKRDKKLKETPFLSNLFRRYPDLKELFYKYGIRNASLLSIAPTGCLSIDTRIKAISEKMPNNIDSLSIKNILEINNIDYEKIHNNKMLHDMWIDLEKPIYVIIDSLVVEVKKIYYGGKKPYITIELEDGSKIDCSYEHKFYIKDGNLKREILASELKEGMDLI